MLFNATRNIGITICLVLLSTGFSVSAQVSGPMRSEFLSKVGYGQIRQRPCERPLVGRL